MMVSFSGAKRSGKSMTMAMLATLDAKRRKIISTIPGLKCEHHRLGWKDLIMKVVDEDKSTSKVEKYKWEVNWPFWEEHKGQSLYIDEIHNIISNTDYMKRESKSIHKWVKQISKIQMDRGDLELFNSLKIKSRKYVPVIADKFCAFFIYDLLLREANFYFNSQRINFIDKDFRDLSDIHIHVFKKRDYTGRMRIYNMFFLSDHIRSGIDNFEAYESGNITPENVPFTSSFYADEWYDVYDTEKITLEDGGLV